MYLEPLAISLFWEKRKKKKTQNQGFFDFQKLQKPETRGHYKIKELPVAHYNCLALSIFSLICKCN
jgi:hypothetical protein